jgi:hypothetical protein
MVLIWLGVTVGVVAVPALAAPEGALVMPFKVPSGCAGWRTL